MEDADSDAEMADYGTDFSDDVDPNFQVDENFEGTLESGIDPPFSRFWGGFPDSRFPIGRESESGIGKSPVSRFGREPGIGVPPRRGGTPGISWSVIGSGDSEPPQVGPQAHGSGDSEPLQLEVGGPRSPASEPPAWY
jgi:hypothetical protein